MTTTNINEFIRQTSKDYDFPKRQIKDIYRRYWPNKFYEKLEELSKNHVDPACETKTSCVEL